MGVIDDHLNPGGEVNDFEPETNSEAQAQAQAPDSQGKVAKTLPLGFDCQSNNPIVFIQPGLLQTRL